jgi:hypothetical protein
MLTFTKNGPYHYVEEYTIKQLINCLKETENPTYGLLLDISQISGITDNYVTTKWVSWAGKPGLIEALEVIEKQGYKDFAWNARLPLEFQY